jgi:hypothetical protein
VCGKRKGKRGRGKKMSWAGAAWAGGPAVHGGIRGWVLDLNLNSLFKFKSHTIESNKFENPIQSKCINPSVTVHVFVS